MKYPQADWQGQKRYAVLTAFIQRDEMILNECERADSKDPNVRRSKRLARRRLARNRKNL